MNVRLSLHNVLMVGIIAVLFILALRLAAPRLKQVPVLGSVAATAATA